MKCKTSVLATRSLKHAGFTVLENIRLPKLLLGRNNLPFITSIKMKATTALLSTDFFQFCETFKGYESPRRLTSRTAISLSIDNRNKNLEISEIQITISPKVITWSLKRL